MPKNLVDQAVAEIEKWLKASGMNESRLGNLACANPRAVERIRDGRGNVATLKALLDYVAKHPM